MVSWIDWIVIVVYILMLLFLGWWLGRKQNSTDEYFVGGRSLTWPIIGISAMATQLSAISFISAPGFVGLRPGGGFIWLGYEFAVPLAMLILIMIVYPVFYRTKIVTIYEYLNKRFDSSIRLAISLVFQISRVFATGITIHMTAIVFQTAFNIPYLMTILLVSIVTIIYATMGGIKAIIYADVIQMVIIFAGIFVCGFYALHLMGGWEVLCANLDPARLKAVDFTNWGYKNNSEFGFWPLFFGGLFLYLSYYGCDQTQSQRLISSKNMKHLNLSLVFNGLARYPMVLAYCLMGLTVGTFALVSPEFMGAIPRDAENIIKADYMLPVFIVNYLPVGIVGLLLVAVFSAAMSSISGTINSLSAASLKDIIIPYFKKDMDNDSAYKWSIGLTIFWGLICTFAVVFAQIAPTVLEAINKVGSLFYGCVLAIFVLGMCTRRANATGCKIGLVFGLALNFYLWIGVPELSWFWWNLTGFIATWSVGYASSVIDLILKEKKIRIKNVLKSSVIYTVIWGITSVALIFILAQNFSEQINFYSQIGYFISGVLMTGLVVDYQNKNENSQHQLPGLIIGLALILTIALSLTQLPVSLLIITAIFAVVTAIYYIYINKQRFDTDVDTKLLISKELIFQPELPVYSTILIGFFVFILVLSIYLKQFFF